AREANAGLQSIASQSVPECQSRALALSQSKKGQKPFHLECPEDCRPEHNHFPARPIRRGSGTPRSESSKPCFGELLHSPPWREDRKSTRLNSSHVAISYAVFCLKK